MTPRHCLLARNALVAVASAALVCGLGGCYERVVRASGPGADQYQISDPYAEDTKLDRWFYGESTSTRSGSLLDRKK